MEKSGPECMCFAVKPRTNEWAESRVRPDIRYFSTPTLWFHHLIWNGSSLTLTGCRWSVSVVFSDMRLVSHQIICSESPSYSRLYPFCVLYCLAHVYSVNVGWVKMLVNSWSASYFCKKYISEKWYVKWISINRMWLSSWFSFREERSLYFYLPWIQK